MSYGLVQTTPPTTEPVTVALLDQHLRLATTTEDSLLSMYITSARTLVEEWTQRQLLTATWTLYLDEWSKWSRVWGFGDSMAFGAMYYPISYYPMDNWWKNAILLPKSPLQSVTSIQYYDVNNTLQTLATNQYYVDSTREPARIELQSFPSLTGTQAPRVIITYTSGYGTASQVPLPLNHMILLLAADFYRNRESTTELRLNRLPLGFAGLLDVYRISVLDNYGTY